MAAQPDRELRRTIVQLRALPDTDFDSIVGELDDSQRSHVLGLLADFDGVNATETAPQMVADPVMLPPELSPWLAARVNGRGDSGDETADPFMIAPHAQTALRRCAAAMMPQPQAKPPRPSLLERIWQGVS